MVTSFTIPKHGAAVAPAIDNRAVQDSGLVNMDGISRLIDKRDKVESPFGGMDMTWDQIKEMMDQALKEFLPNFEAKIPKSNPWTFTMNE